MIICHDYKFIFLKTRKTAGTSVEIALSNYCKEGDVLAPLVKKDEKARRATAGIGKQNYVPPIRNYGLCGWLKLLRTKHRIQYSNHTTAEDVFSTLDSSIWKNYFKFCFERNPWDKAVSWYYWKTNGNPNPPSIDDFLAQEEPAKLSNYGIYSLSGEVAVDYVARYENLSSEWEFIAKRLNLPEHLQLPRAKGKSRPAKAGYRDVLSQNSKALIDRVCHREIDLLGYSF